MERLTYHVHKKLEAALRTGDWVVDATVGNGHDTLFLAKAVGEQGSLWGFDIQQAALDAAHLEARVSLILACHSQLKSILPPEAHGKLKAVLFNLGYLPGGNKGLITQPATTLAALQAALSLLQPGGAISIVLYKGHPGGPAEAAAVEEYLQGLSPDQFETQWLSTPSKTGPAWVWIRRLAGCP